MSLLLLRRSVVDADAAAWVSAVRAAGGQVSSAQAVRVSTLTLALKKAGVWSSLDRLWLFAAENSTQALIDLKARATATATNSPTFTANRGYAGGTTSYINTNFNPSTAGGNYTQNSATYGCWVETAESSPASLKRLAGNDSSNYSEFSTGAGSYGYSVNQGAPGNSQVSSTSTGCFDFSRVAASGAGAVNCYWNGSLTDATTHASIAIPNNNMFALASNNAGAPYQNSDARLAGLWSGGGLTATQVAAFYAARRAYMTAVGVA